MAIPLGQIMSSFTSTLRPDPSRLALSILGMEPRSVQYILLRKRLTLITSHTPVYEMVLYIKIHLL